jgi:hypothetical protein
MSGNAFLRQCSPTPGKANPFEFFCAGYVVGLIEGADFEAQWVEADLKLTRKASKAVCRPAAVENGQLVKVVLKFIDAHPEQAHLPTVAIVMYALSEAYPCPK